MDVEPMLGEWAAHGQPTTRLGTVKNSPGLLGRTEIGPCVFQPEYCLNCVKKKKKLLMHIIKCVNMMMNYIKI